MSYMVIGQNKGQVDYSLLSGDTCVIRGTHVSCLIKAPLSVLIWLAIDIYTFK